MEGKRRGLVRWVRMRYTYRGVYALVGMACQGLRSSCKADETLRHAFHHIPEDIVTCPIKGLDMLHYHGGLVRCSSKP